MPGDRAVGSNWTVPGIAGIKSPGCFRRVVGSIHAFTDMAPLCEAGIQDIGMLRHGAQLESRNLDPKLRTVGSIHAFTDMAPLCEAGVQEFGMLRHGAQFERRILDPKLRTVGSIHAFSGMAPSCEASIQDIDMDCVCILIGSVLHVTQRSGYPVFSRDPGGVVHAVVDRRRPSLRTLTGV